MFSSLVSNTSIGITIEKNGKVVFPDSGSPYDLGWGKSWCRDSIEGESLIIHEAQYWSSWKSRQKLNAAFLGGIEVRLEQAGRNDTNFGINLVSRPEDISQIPNSASWMTDLLADSDLSLNQICIPGSHDSGTYAISTYSGLDPEMDEALKGIFDIAGNALALPIKDIVKAWSITQTLNTYNQLKSGIRYLDIRARMVNGTLYTAHGLLGATIADMLDEIRRFLDEHPKEVVIFDIQELLGMSQQDIDQLYTLLNKYFAGQIAPSNMTSSTPISDFQEKGVQLIVVSNAWPNGYSNWQRGQNLSSPWFDQNEPYPLLQKLAQGIRYRSNDRFYVSQVVLTSRDSDMKLMVLGTSPANLWELDNTLRYRSGFAQYLHNAARASGQLSNIMLQDFPESGDLYNNCMQENIRRLEQ
ncbi:hypothetical protein [Endozoicomonas sp. OPT23]|uniref:hypothetical protein n=1 Tax=Endozoicomonas sp. OPT23 TaxID=2072845 RepID=UPI00129A1F24|nr:hypothetical protein [Endozoicomonas sp. OPT23]